MDGFLDMYFGIEFNEDDNTLKRYQINLTDDIKAVAYREVLSRMQQAYINGGTSVQDLVKQTESKYQQEIEGIKKKAKTMEIIPYYGDRKFMEYRIEYIIECIERMLQHPKFQNREDIMQELLNVQDFYMTFKNISLETDSIPQQKNNYRLLEELYKQVVGIEDKLSKDVEELWLERMAEKNSQEGQMAYFAHVLTDGEFDPKDMDKVCVTYITEKTQTLPYGDYGFIYPMKMKDVVQISTGDAGSWKLSKEKFIETGLPSNWQFTEPIDKNGNRMFFEYPPKNSRLLLPDDVEQATIEATIKSNGEMLNYDKHTPYNEAVIINKDGDMMPIAVFVKTFGNEEHSEKFQNAKALSERLGLPLREIDISRLRENLGLTPLTPKEMKRNAEGR